MIQKVREICASAHAHPICGCRLENSQIVSGICAVYFTALPTLRWYVTEIQICDSIIERHYCGLRRLRKIKHSISPIDTRRSLSFVSSEIWSWFCVYLDVRMLFIVGTDTDGFTIPRF
ncbi:hypothetical protein CDAR_64891 [Caerostris darwini]|uniref:Uncharacterized protein n=1 Tax=Caerostris darwini TaxID=1538125 RepID=A0AAV4SLR6_9ARAC|nr:hypothetical protein CDAR_64891 [Caerostris darwini]